MKAAATKATAVEPAESTTSVEPAKSSGQRVRPSDRDSHHDRQTKLDEVFHFLLLKLQL